MTTTKPFWHELTKDQREDVIKSGITVGELMERYSQPDWCGYPDALGGIGGCWSLILSNSIRCQANCGQCDCQTSTLAK